jgi:hypothetical protein
MVEQLLGVQTDASMPRQVWINLISNALTSTQGKEPAIIEINARGRASKAISHYRWHGGRTCAESEVGKTRGFSFHCRHGKVRNTMGDLNKILCAEDSANDVEITRQLLKGDFQEFSASARRLASFWGLVNQPRKSLAL